MQVRIFDKRTLIVTNAQFHFMISRAYDYAPIGEVTEVLAYCLMRGKYRKWVVMKKAELTALRSRAQPQIDLALTFPVE